MDGKQGGNPANALLAQAHANRELSSALAHDNADTDSGVWRAGRRIRKTTVGCGGVQPSIPTALYVVAA